MSSIEDILNSSDSDDDELISQNVDLEALLNNKGDDSDDDEISKLLLRNSLEENTISHTVKASTMPLTSQYKFTTTINPPTKLLDAQMMTSKVPGNSNLIVVEGDKTKLGRSFTKSPKPSSIFDQVLEQDDAAPFNSLEMADQREQRFLKTGTREVVSALQAKRSSSALSSYSNLKLEDLATISSQLKRNGNYKQHGPGAASSVMVSTKFIAVGTTRGLVILFDHTQEIRQVVGASVQPPNRSAAPVTSMDVAWQQQHSSAPSLLLCGYATGEVALWDLAKGAVVKRINDLHASRVMRASFVRPAGFEELSASTLNNGGEMVIVTADCKGVMHRTRFVKALWTAYTAESECLLDGTSGPIIDMCVLNPYSDQQAQTINVTPKSAPRQFLGLLRSHSSAQFLAFNFVAQTCVVQTAPFVKIIHKWPAPGSANASTTSSHGSVACLDWGWRSSSGGGADDPDSPLEVAPVLVRCWGSMVEMLRMDLLPPTEPNSSIKEPPRYQFKVVHRSQFDGQVFVSVKWMSPTRLLLLSLTSALVLSGEGLDLVEQSPLVPAIAVNFSTLMSSRGGADDSAFLNSTCVSGRHAYVLSGDHLFRAQLQSCFELAHQLIHAGQWLEALALILENVAKSPSLLVTDGAEVDRCIYKYVQLAINSSATLAAASSSSTSSGALLSPQSRNHYHLVAGVCIEYCVAARRTELLYSDLLDIFAHAGQEQVFLESLEPYILSRTISTLPPNIIAQFFESCLAQGRLPSIERCVTYFDIHAVDLNFVTRFLFQHRMFSSFLYAFANGLGDFAGAFQIVFQFMLPSAATTGDGGETNGDGGAGTPSAADPHHGYPTATQADVGYKLLLFLLYTFEGRVFPRGDAYARSGDSTPGGSGSEAGLDKSVLMTLLTLVADRTLRPTPSTFSPVDANNSAHGVSSDLRQWSVWFTGDFPYLTCLSYVDPEATLVVVAKGLAVAQQQLVVGEADTGAAELAAVYENVFAFCAHSERDPALATYRMVTMFIERCLDLICTVHCVLSPALLEATVRHCAYLSDRQAAELRMGQLAERQTRCSSRIGALLRQVLCDNQFFSAALSARISGSSNGNFEKALRFYIELASKGQTAGGAGGSKVSAALTVFEYIAHQFQSFEPASGGGGDGEDQRASFCREIVKLIAELYRIDAGRTTAIASAHLAGSISDLISYTQHDSRMQFQLLDAVVEGLEQQSQIDQETNGALSPSSSTGGGIKESFSPKNLAAYFKLKCVYDAPRVLGFLRRHVDLLSLDECLTACREQGISDAVAFLLERGGDLASALATLQRELSQRIRLARRDIDAQLKVDLAAASSFAASASGSRNRSLVSQILSKQGTARVEAASRLPVFKTLSTTLDCAADLCAAHATTEDPAMWFGLFDHLLIERQTIRSGTVSSSGEIVIVLIGLLLQALMNRMKGGGGGGGAAGGAGGSLTNAEGSTCRAVVISPQDIIRRVTTQSHAVGVRLGEFRDVMSNMLASNAHELALSETVNHMLLSDLVALQTEKVARVRRGTFHRATDLRDAERVGDGDASTVSEGGDSPVHDHRRRSRGWRNSGSHSDKRRFHTFSALSDTDSSHLSCAPPPVAADFTLSTDHEERRPGSLQLRAAATAELRLRQE